MAITDKKVSETYAGRDISSLSDRPNEDGLTGAQLKARFDQLGKEVIPNYNDLIDELNDVVLPSKADQSTTYTKIDVDLALTLKVDKEAGKSLVSDATITDLTDGLDTTLHTHDVRYYTETETDVILALKSDVGHTHDDRYYTETESDSLLNAKVDKVAGQSLVSDSVMTDLTDLGDSSAHYHSTDRNTDNHTDGTTNKVFSATEKIKLAGVETGAEVNNISDINATDLTDGLNTTLHIHTADRDTDNHTDGVTNKVFTAIEKSKLNGIEALAEVNNISDVNATDLTDGGNTTLHIHDIYVDKVAGKSLVSDTAITDLTDSGDTTLHTHKSIQNEVSVDNAKVEALSTGVKFERNVADANTTLLVNVKNASSTGNIVDFTVTGISKAYLSRAGVWIVGSTGYQNGGMYYANSDNSYVNVLSTGTKISRNIADANPALIVNQVNPSSTGKILDLQFGGVSKMNVGTDGTIYGQTLANRSSFSNSYLDLVSTGTNISRNIADANSCLKINQNHTSSTGLITDFQFGGVSKASVDKDGVIKIGTKTPASATATGVAGTVCWDSSYIYVCINTNVWVRAALSTW